MRACVRACAPAQCAACLTARNQYGEYLGGGFGIPRSKILDSLNKEISLENAANSLRRPVVDSNTLSEFTTIISTAGGIVAMAFVAPEQARYASVVAMLRVTSFHKCAQTASNFGR